MRGVGLSYLVQRRLQPADHLRGGPLGAGACRHGLQHASQLVNLHGFGNARLRDDGAAILDVLYQSFSFQVPEDLPDDRPTDAELFA